MNMNNEDIERQKRLAEWRKIVEEVWTNVWDEQPKQTPEQKRESLRKEGLQELVYRHRIKTIDEVNEMNKEKDYILDIAINRMEEANEETRRIEPEVKRLDAQKKYLQDQIDRCEAIRDMPLTSFF